MQMYGHKDCSCRSVAGVGENKSLSIARKEECKSLYFVEVEAIDG